MKKIRSARHMLFHIPWNQKTVYQRFLTINFFIASAVLVWVIVWAFSRHHDTKTDEKPMGKGSVFSIDLTSEIPKRDIVPGDEITAAPTVTNTGTDPAYIFLRFDCNTFTDPADNEEKSIYSFSIDEGDRSKWTQVESDNPGQLIFAYGSESDLTVVQPQESVTLPGTLKLVMDSGSFVEIDEAGLTFRVTGCGIDTLGSNNSAGAYNEYIAEGGE